MSPHALTLVLVAALCHALWNLSAKQVVGDGRLVVFCYAVASLVIWTPVTVVWLVAHHQSLAWAWLLGAAVSGVLHAAYGTVLQHGYAVGDLNLVYPTARGVGPLVTLVVAIGVLGERLSAAEAAGALVILAGIAVITVPARPSLRTARQRRGLVWGAATGLSIAAYTLWDNHAVNGLHVPPLPYFTLSLAFQALPFVPRAMALRPRLGEVRRRNRNQILVVAVLSPLAYVLVLEAMRLAPVGLVAAARETSIVVGALLGYVILREPHPTRRFVGAAVVLGGIALLVS
jgi:drug/metabolite transporter (DMT)-like permease